MINIYSIINSYLYYCVRASSKCLSHDYRTCACGTCPIHIAILQTVHLNDDKCNLIIANIIKIETNKNYMSEHKQNV